MTLYLAILSLLLSSQLSSNAGDFTRQLKLSILGQKTVQNESEIPWADRRIMFRMVNGTGKLVILPGSKTGSGFFPTGYLVRFDRKKKAWLNPSGSRSQLAYTSVANTQTDRYELKPGESLEFYDMAESIHAGDRFRKLVYVFVEKENSDPQVIQSETFVLR
jgi:hypothetical protein